MAISLVKGQRLELDKGLTQLKVEMGWSVGGNTTYELDASTFLLGAYSQIEDEANFVFYGSKKRVEAKDANGHTIYDETGKPVTRPVSLDGSVIGSIDDLGTDDDDTGEGSEEIDIDLTKTAPNVKEILFTVSIYFNPNDPRDPRRRYNFGQVRNAFIQIRNTVNNEVICRYDLDEDFSIDKGVEFGRLYRRGNEWKFQAVGEGHADGLGAICNKYASKFM